MMFRYNKISRFFKIIVFIALLFVLVAQCFFLTSEQNKVDYYAVLICAADNGHPQRHPDNDPIDVNVGIITLSKIYATLTKCGYEDKHIFILYCANLQPDWSEQFNRKHLQLIKAKHFSGRYSNKATKKNVNTIITSLKSTVDDNDCLIFYLLAHGESTGVVQLSGDKWSPQEIQTTLGGFKSRTNIFLFDVCQGGSILDRTNFNNAVCLAATSAKTPGWIDRNFSNCANFLAHKANQRNDINTDGIVDYDEAFEATVKSAQEYEPGWKEYLMTQYKPDKPLPPGIIEKTSIVPEMKVGKDYVKSRYPISTPLESTTDPE